MGENMGEINAIIFDIDDTLFDQLEWLEGAFSKVGELVEDRFGVSKKIVGKKLRRLTVERGSASGNLFNLALEELGIQETPALIEEAIVAFYSYHPKKLTLYPGVKETLSKLKACGFKLGVISEGREKMQIQKLKALGIHHFFDATLIVKLHRGEPRGTSSYTKILKVLKSEPNECIYVGDNPYKDFVNAKKLSIHTIRVFTGEYREKKVDKNLDADFSVNNIREILEVVEKLQRLSTMGRPKLEHRCHF